MQEAKIEAEKIVERLVNSFSDLEKAIEGAKANLSKLDTVPAEVISRLDSYYSLVEKQRALAKSLEDHVCSGNTQEISRHIGLINGLSGMIIDDAKGILSGLSDENLESEDSTHFC
jgi:archaellum component FlaC